MDIFNFFKSKKKSMDSKIKISVEEQLNTLIGLGIKPKYDDYVDWICDEWGRETVETDPYNLMLFSLGGERETDDGETWELLSDDIYSFDTECVEDDNIYEVVLGRLATLSKGKFNISNLHSTVDHDCKKAAVSFAYNSADYKWDLKYDDDWFDCDTIGKINLLLKNNGSTKFFFTCSLDQNLILVFDTEKNVKELNQLVTFPFILSFSETV